MKTIIVPLDLSNEALTGLDMALMLAHKTDAHVKMVYVITQNEAKTKDIDRLYEQVILKFESLLKSYENKNTIPNKLSYTIKEGTIYSEISKLADSFGEAVIVTTTHGHSGFEELFVGRNAYKIVFHSRLPVITFRKCEIPNGISKIVLPLYIGDETCEQLPYTILLAKLFNSEVHILVVHLSKYKNIQKKLHSYALQLGDCIKKHNISFVIKETEGDNLTDLTLKYANTINADLISILIEQEKNFSSLILGTYTHQMINQSIIPVLCLPNHQKILSNKYLIKEDISYG